MTEPANETRLAAAAMPLGLFVYTLLYGGMTVLAGVLAFKQVQLWPTELAVESGIFAFLLLVQLTHFGLWHNYYSLSVRATSAGVNPRGHATQSVTTQLSHHPEHCRVL